MSSATNTKRNFVNDEEDNELRRGPWTLDEDTLLIHYIACHGEGRWDMLAKCSGLKRTGKSCRLRWLNYLKPDVKRGNLTLEEQIIILELHSKWGNRWSRIAQHLPGRTDNEIKNYWRTRVQKQARQLKIDANSKKFQDAIRSFWMPRLLQKIEESSHSSSSSSPASSSSSTYNSQNMKSQTSPAPLLLNQSPRAPEPTKEPIGYSYIEQESNPNSMNISQFSEISGYPVSPNAFGSNFYAMEAFNMAPPMSEMENSYSNCPVEESQWMNHEDSLWNMDELWQFRKLQEKGI